MRGYVEALEAWESELPEGVEPDYDQFYKIFRGEQPLEYLGEPRQIRSQDMSPSK